MFYQVKASPSNGLRPETSDISQSDWDVLANYWYPVLLEKELSNKPIKTKLLDVELVIFRGKDGIAITLDMCPHRQVRLSIGSVVDGNIVCPFHGLAFNGKGQCVHVPALGVDGQSRIPKKYCVESFKVEVRYGIIWTCLNIETTQSVPHFPSVIDVPVENLVYNKVVDWPVSAPRQIENFCDLAHLPFIHEKTLGGDKMAPAKPGKITQLDDSVEIIADYTEAPFGGEPRTVKMTYKIVLPFIVDFLTVDPEGNEMDAFEIASPVSAYECQVYQFTKNPGGKNSQLEQLVNGLDVVNTEDITVLSENMMHNLPLNNKFEIHLPSDNVCHAYRSRLRDLGLGQ